VDRDGSVAVALGLLLAASDLSPTAALDEVPSAASVSDDTDDAKAIGKMAPLDYTVKNGADVKPRRSRARSSCSTLGHVVSSL
jgi:hypothetical protein